MDQLWKLKKLKQSFYILATLLEPVVEIWRFNLFPFEIWCIMAFCLLQKSFAYVGIIFSSKQEVKICG